MMQPKLNTQQITDRYVETVNAAWSRWSHRRGFSGRPGGHYDRTWGKARKQAAEALRQWEYSEEQIRQALRDMDEVAKLERDATEE